MSGNAEEHTRRQCCINWSHMQILRVKRQWDVSCWQQKFGNLAMSNFVEVLFSNKDIQNSDLQVVQGTEGGVPPPSTATIVGVRMVHIDVVPGIVGTQLKTIPWT